MYKREVEFSFSLPRLKQEVSVSASGNVMPVENDAPATLEDLTIEVSGDETFDFTLLTQEEEEAIEDRAVDKLFGVQYEQE